MGNPSDTDISSEPDRQEESWQARCFRMVSERNDTIPFEYRASDDTLVFTRYLSGGTTRDFNLPRFTECICSDTAHNRENAGLFKSALVRTRATGGFGQFECRINVPTAIDPGPTEGDFCRLTFSDSPRWWRVMIALIEGQGDATHLLYGVATDIQSEKEKVSALLTSLEEESSFVHSFNSNAIMAMDFDTETGNWIALRGEAVPSFISENMTLRELIDFLSMHAINQDDEKLIADFDNAEKIANAKKDGSSKSSFDCLLKPLDDSYTVARWAGFTYLYTLDPITDHVDIFIHIIDIDEKKRTQLSLLNLTTKDSLTGLLNGVAFKNGCERYLDRKSDTPLHESDIDALALIEIDSFGQINDRYGHVFGDRVLQKTADTLRAMAHENDIFAHLNGSRFAFFTAKTTDIAILRERIRVLNMALSTKIDEENMRTASIGVALCPADGQTLMELYDNADKALASSRQNGGNRYTFYSTDLEDVGTLRPSNHLTDAIVGSRPAVHIKTFGYFDVFVGGKPVVFHYAKAKELLALLVDRQGGFVTSTEAIGNLWEDEPANKTTLGRYRKVAMRLKQVLEANGIADIMEVHNGARRIVPERVQCDLFNYLSGISLYSNLFNGTYMSNYSWGENTLGVLMRS